MAGISKRNQITIPAKAMTEAGLKAGDEVLVVVTAPGRLELVGHDALVSHFAGALDEDSYPPGYLEQLRGEWR